MDSNTIIRDIDLIASVGGATLTLEQRSSLPSALAVCQNENNFVRMVLWGRITGDKSDYIIAQGFSPSSDENRERSKIAGGNLLLSEYYDVMALMPKKNFRLSPDGVKFVPIPLVDDEVRRKNDEFLKALHAKGQVFVPFSGDPSSKVPYEFVIPPPPRDPKAAAAAAPAAGEDGEEGEEKAPEEEEEPKATIEEREISEEERLAFIIEQIDLDTMVVPRGAFILNSNSQVVQNSAFRGLEEHEARKLANFLHLRRPILLPRTPHPERKLLDRSLDFLDNLSWDIPKGCWAISYDGINAVASLRSLRWPGYSFFHSVRSNSFGSFYSGTGERNLDIAFML